MPISPDADNAAHVVQLALTPAFLLTGIALLLNVFTQRLARISDQVSRLAAEPTQRPRQLARLRLRSRLLDAAVLLAAFAAEMGLAGRAVREMVDAEDPAAPPPAP